MYTLNVLYKFNRQHHSNYVAGVLKELMNGKKANLKKKRIPAVYEELVLF